MDNPLSATSYVLISLISTINFAKYLKIGKTRAKKSKPILKSDKIPSIFQTNREEIEKVAGIFAFFFSLSLFLVTSVYLLILIF